jgi:hypothetical protein
MWDELGRRIVVLRFDDGELKSYEIADYSSGGDWQVCRYQEDKLVSDHPAGCPPFEDVRAGLPTVERTDEPLVPADRDPRR